jgi:hypothetical protein
MAANCFPIFFGYISLYIFLVTIACSQLEKLRASLLDIRQRHAISEQDSNAETGLEGQGQGHGQVHTSQEVFRHMQEKLNDCVRHHQDILRYVNVSLKLQVLPH